MALHCKQGPYSLTSFAGQAVSTGNQLSWATAQGVKSASFVVEASADGSTSAAVAELAAAGNSTSARTYRYLDATAAAKAPQATAVALLSLTGRLVYTALPGLPAGVYVLRLTTTSGTISHKVPRQ